MGSARCGVAVRIEQCNSQVRELVMAKQNLTGAEGRKAWLVPELRRLRAGAAEFGTGTVPDTGGPGNSRS
jgi:hypothetical protein